MSYDFTRYTGYMARHDLDAVIASNYDLTARMLGDYFKDLGLITHGCREYNRLIGCNLISNAWELYEGGRGDRISL